jgi:hypothetical protein
MGNNCSCLREQASPDAELPCGRTVAKRSPTHALMKSVFKGYLIRKDLNILRMQSSLALSSPRLSLMMTSASEKSFFNPNDMEKLEKYKQEA